MAERVVEIETPFFDPEPNVRSPCWFSQSVSVTWNIGIVKTSVDLLSLRDVVLPKFGYPNDEGRWGHRLYPKGLRSYGVFEVLESEWLVELRKSNAKAFPDFTAFEGGRHFIFAFHDSTFECIALNSQAADEFPKLDPKMLQLDESL